MKVNVTFLKLRLSSRHSVINSDGVIIEETEEERKKRKKEKKKKKKEKERLEQEKLEQEGGNIEAVAPPEASTKL